MQQVSSIKTRNSSFDLLRIISMLMIVVLHVNSHGGVLNNISQVNTTIARLFEYFSVCAVNVFVLISGYFLSDSTFKLSRVIKLLLQVWFYSWVINIIMVLAGEATLSAKDLISIAFPISYKEYWFITAYIIMYLLSPALNSLIKSLTQHQHKLLIITLFLLTSVWHDLIPASDPLFINNGYSFFWFIVLYLISAYIKKYDFSLKKPACVYFVCCVAMFLSSMILHAIVNGHTLLENYLPVDHFGKYCSVLNVISSISLFCFFRKTRIKHGDIFSRIAPYIFGVYLIHDNIHLRDFIWINLFKLSNNDTHIIPHAVIAVLCTFVICLLFDYLRSIIFSLLFREGLWTKIDNWFSKKTNIQRME